MRRLTAQVATGATALAVVAGGGWLVTTSDQAQASAGPVAAVAGTSAAKAAKVRTTVPSTPGVPTYRGVKQGRTRTFRITALELRQQIATFPTRTARVWGYKATPRPDSTATTPGPTLIAYEGERVRFVVTNELPEATSIHPHGTHQPRGADGVAGIDFNPIQPGETRAYPAYVPGHPGTFAYHTHTSTANQEPRGLAGLLVVLPRRTSAADNPQVDVGMTLQQFNPSDDGGLNVTEGGMATTMPNDRGMWPYNTINGKTGDASGEPIRIRRGDLVQIRLYNASSMSHSMHLHGQDMKLVASNGHPVKNPMTVTTKAIAPGEFFTLQFRANNPGTWVFHCSFPDHQANDGQSGYRGAPVGMTRIFQYAGQPAVPEEYFGPPES